MWIIDKKCALVFSSQEHNLDCFIINDKICGVEGRDVNISS